MNTSFPFKLILYKNKSTIFDISEHIFSILQTPYTYKIKLWLQNILTEPH